MSRPDFRAVAARRLAEDRELSPGIVSLISSDKSDKSLVRQIPLERIVPNPHQPRLLFDQSSIEELSASIREHGVLQPILVRPLPTGGFQLIAGERRWRASKVAGLGTIPALVEELDDDAAMEIAIIENLQREDLSPLDEAIMYDRMIREHGYSVRRLAQKLGKDKGYVENRIRLADAPDDIKRLVSVRKDTLSHAYELLKVTDPATRAQLAEEVATGSLSLVKLRERIDGRPRPVRRPRFTEGTIEVDVILEAPEALTYDEAGIGASEAPVPEAMAAPAPAPAPVAAPAVAPAMVAPVPSPASEQVVTRLAPLDATDADALVMAKQRLADAIEELGIVLRAPSVLASIDSIDRANLAKYLTIVKLKLENTIAAVRTGDTEA